MTRAEAIRQLTNLFGTHPDNIADDLVDDFLDYMAPMVIARPTKKEGK